MPHAAWPVDPGVVGPFLIAVLLIELTPGPNMSWLAVLAATRGRAAGFAAVAGVTAGLAVYMLAAAFGVGEVVLRAPGLYQALRWAGVAYLLWLAYEAWTSRGDGAGSPAEPDAADRRQAALRGFVANVLNPKAAVFYITLLPTFMRPDHANPVAQALLLGSVHLGVAVAVHASIVTAAARAQALAQSRLAGRLSAVAIAAIALWMLWETGRSVPA
ncbi:MAG: LysE family translocator [Alphaproteobacteria bacterium]|nr:LysE family translocator [Alphaproteobacteria bacterium]